PLRQTAHHDQPHRYRDSGIDRVDWARLGGNDRVKGLGWRLTLERVVTGQHFVDNRAEGELIGRRTGRLPHRLFGGHVTKGTDCRALIDRNTLALRDPEVEHLHETIGGDHDVLG